jgi:hypothetical protein
MGLQKPRAVLCSLSSFTSRVRAGGDWEVNAKGPWFFCHVFSSEIKPSLRKANLKISSGCSFLHLHSNCGWNNCTATAYGLSRTKPSLSQPAPWWPVAHSLAYDVTAVHWICLGYFIIFPSVTLKPLVRFPYHLLWLEWKEWKKMKDWFLPARVAKIPAVSVIVWS